LSLRTILASDVFARCAASARVIGSPVGRMIRLVIVPRVCWLNATGAQQVLTG
jgi:hypothetical protein